MVRTATQKLDIDAIRVVSWDVDGTLYSNQRAARHAVITAAKLTVRRFDLDPLKQLRELAALWSRVEPARADAGNLSHVHAGADRRHELERRWWAPAIAASGPRPGVREVLGHFQARAQVQVILSDYDADYKLEGLGLGEYFDRAYSGERIGSFKPSSVPFFRILEDYGIEPECLLHIGDRVDTDGTGAAGAGCPSLVLSKDFRSFGQLYTMLTSNSHIADSNSLRGIQ